MRTLLAAVLGVSLVSALVPAKAIAQSSGEARTQLATGDKAARVNDWDPALRAYRAANASLKSAKAQAGIALALARMGKAVDAYEAYDELVKTYGAAMSKKDRADAEKGFSEVALATGYLSIRVNEAGAQVNVDGEPVGTSPVAALLRVMRGAHRVAVSKEGFVPFAQSAEVGPNGKAIVEVALRSEARLGRVVVKEKSGRALRVTIDGVDVGSTPYEADLEPGAHTLGGRSATLTAPQHVIEVARGKTNEVELVASPFIARLEVHTSDGKGFIVLDGKPVAEGAFAGEVAVGTHLIAVTREGYERYEKRVVLADRQTLVEAVTLKQTGVTLAASSTPTVERTLQGVYGGLQLGFTPLPAGTKNSVETACDALGASSCDKSFPLGGTLGLYLGYAIDPIAFELFGAVQGDVTRPVAQFDGKNGSSINPLVAAPARDESFTFARIGGLGALRVRASWQTAGVRFSIAGGVGFAYKLAVMTREATTTDPPGGRSAFNDAGKGYLSPGVSLDVGVQLRLTSSLALALGAMGWVENAGQSTASRARDDQAIAIPTTPRSAALLATPSYDMANGAQIFVGPYAGVQFGP